MENIILTGMPGCGKSTVGVILAKTFGMEFIDTDLIIQIQQRDKLQRLVDKFGTDCFRTFEEKALLSVNNRENTGIATGGSAVYGDDGMKHLSEISVIVYLKVPVSSLNERLSNIRTRGVVMKKGESIEQLFQRRSPLYEKYAEITVDCSALRAEECVDEIIGKLNG